MIKTAWIITSEIFPKAHDFLRATGYLPANTGGFYYCYLNIVTRRKGLSPFIFLEDQRHYVFCFDRKKNGAEQMSDRSHRFHVQFRRRNAGGDGSGTAGASGSSLRILSFNQTSYRKITCWVYSSHYEIPCPSAGVSVKLSLKPPVS